MLTGPAPATRKALAKAGLTIDDIDLVEINEAFAAVVLRFARDMGLPLDKVNVNGGAIALGHPLGATGAMILGTLVDELERQRQALRPGHAVRRRRHGHRHRHRAALTPVRPRPPAPPHVRRAPTMTEPTTTTIRWEQDETGVVTLVLDDPDQSANTMNQAFQDVPRRGRRPPGGRERTPSAASSSPPPRRPSSPAATSRPDPGHAPRTPQQRLRRRHARSSATCAASRPSASPSSPRSTARPSAAAYEIALACHHRIALDAPGSKIGCPRSPSACCPAAAASPAPSACWASPTRC